MARVMHHLGKHPTSSPFHRPILALGLVIGLFLFPLSSAGASDLPDPDAPGLGISERVAALVERVKAEQAALETMEADFVQRKESELFLEPEEATGHFWYRSPGDVRWDFTDPEPTVVLIDGEAMTTWYKELERAERYDIGQQADRIMEYLSASNSLETLQQYFSMTASFPKDPTAPYVLELKPLFRRVAKRVAGMTLKVDREGFFPVYLRYIEPDGDVTEYTFSDVSVNHAIADEQFALELPEGLELREVDLGDKRKAREQEERAAKRARDSR